MVPALAYDWQEFELAQDSANFVTLHPLAFQVISTPGVLVAVLESLNAIVERWLAR